jgi:4a-hydroxytetrahydrobiopterin dehydratase
VYSLIYINTGDNFMALLSENEIAEKLGSLEGWGQEGNQIVKQFKFKNFIQSIGFVSKVAMLAERVDHHPDILIQYSKVTITLSTHSEGGLTDKDFNLASEIQEVS